MSLETPTQKAIRCAGGQVLLAKLIGVSTQAVQQWKTNNKIPAERVISVEKHSGVSRHEIRPDIYPSDSAQAA